MGWGRKEVTYRTNSTPHPTLAPGTFPHPKAHTHTNTLQHENQARALEDKVCSLRPTRLQTCLFDVVTLCLVSRPRLPCPSVIPRGPVCHLFLAKENISSSTVSICLLPTEPPGTVIDWVLRSLVPEWKAADALMSPRGPSPQES